MAPFSPGKAGRAYVMLPLGTLAETCSSIRVVGHVLNYFRYVSRDFF